MRLYSTLIIFVAEQKEEVFKRLDIMYNNLETGMTKDKYLLVCEQLNKEPNPDRAPPDFNDFPEIVQCALRTFNLLGDRVYPDIGYVGKDYTNLTVYIEIYEVEDKEFFLEVLSWLDSRAIEKSAAQLKREMEKLKRKSSGK